MVAGGGGDDIAKKNTRLVFTKIIINSYSDADSNHIILAENRP